MIKNIFLFTILVWFSGCSAHSIQVTPDLEVDLYSLQSVECKVDYAGNKEYLPRTLIFNEKSNVTAKYIYTTHYVNGNTDWDGLNLFNPLIFVGFPLSHENVIIEGKVEFINSVNKIQVFSASCIASKTRSLFQTGGSSVPRKACLIAVRNNIDMQLKQFNMEDFNE